MVEPVGGRFNGIGRGRVGCNRVNDDISQCHRPDNLQKTAQSKTSTTADKESLTATKNPEEKLASTSTRGSRTQLCSNKKLYI